MVGRATRSRFIYKWTSLGSLWILLGLPLPPGQPLPTGSSLLLSLSLSLLRRSLLSPSSCSSTCANSAASSTPFVASFRSMFYSTAKLILMSERGVARWQPLAHLYRVVRFQQTASETRYICMYIDFSLIFSARSVIPPFNISFNFLVRNG